MAPPPSPVVQKSWSIVLFQNNEVGIVPSNWFLEDKKSCMYPAKTNRYTLNSLTDECAPPKKDWVKWKVAKVIKTDIVDFQVAKEEFIRSEESEAENQSVSTIQIRHELPQFPDRNNIKNVQNDDGNVDADDESEKPPPQKTKSCSTERNLKEKISEKPVNPKNETKNLAGANNITSKSKGDSNDKRSVQQNSSVKIVTSEASSSKGAGSVMSQQQGTSTTPSASNLLNSGNLGCGESPSFQTTLQEGVSVGKQLNQIMGILALQHSQLQNMEKASKKKKNEDGEKNSGSESEEEPLLSACPFKTKGEFVAFDQKLAFSKTMRKKLRDELALKLKKTRESSCVALARNIFSDDVARLYTWKGREMVNQDCKKDAFVDTTMFNIISQTVNKKFANNPLTEDDYQEALADWFVHAKFRINGRLKRAIDRETKRSEREKEKQAVANAAASSTESSVDERGPSGSKSTKRKKRTKESSKKNSQVAAEAGKLF